MFLFGQIVPDAVAEQPECKGDIGSFDNALIASARHIPPVIRVLGIRSCQQAFFEFAGK